MKGHPFCSQKLFKSKNVIHYSNLPDIFMYQGLVRVLIYVTLPQKERLFQWAHIGGGLVGVDASFPSFLRAEEKENNVSFRSFLCAKENGHKPNDWGKGLKGG